MMAENGITWQETIIISFFMIGAVLVSLIVVRGLVTIVSELTRAILTAINNRPKKNVSGA
jgi:hypothetical protein